MDLRTALRFQADTQAALVGAGGKTTAMFQIARAYASPVIIAPSTHMGVWQAQLADHHLTVTHPDDIAGSAGQIEGVTLFTGPVSADQRLRGLDEAVLTALHKIARQLGIPLLIEADGSRQRPLKAPADHEPVIPEWVDAVVVVAGMSALGQPLGEQWVHRPEKYSILSGLPLGAKITVDGLVKVLSHAGGGRKGIPDKARTAVLLNQVDDDQQMTAAVQAAQSLVPPYDAALITSLAKQRILRIIEPVSAVILAAGGSTRFGQPKMTLPYQGKPLVRIAVEAAQAGGAGEIIVVTGAAEGPVRAALEGFAVRFVHNPEWQAGQSASVRAGLNALSPNAGAAVFLLADQPFIRGDIIQALIEKHQEAIAPVIAPAVEGSRGNPVIFDRSVFPYLSAMQGDAGGRAIFAQFPPDLLEWHDPSILLDIDTPDDYARLTQQDTP